MGKYLKKFENHTAYETYINGNDKVLPNVSYCEDNGVVYYNPIKPNNIITYRASEKLSETTSQYAGGLHTNAFSGLNGSLTITSHTFENGIGVIEFDGDVVTIGKYGFKTCTSLTSIDIPDSVTMIGESAFISCYSLDSINLPNNIISIGKYGFQDCTSLTSIDIPDSVTNIYSYAFSGCKSLTTIIMPSGITSISAYTFNGCSGLTSVTIPSGVTSIGLYAFSGCKSLTTITIPSGVTYIDIYAFSSCSGLTSVIVEAETPPTLDNNTVFNNTNNCPIYVPSGSVDTYKAAQYWSDYASRIQAIPTP